MHYVDLIYVSDITPYKPNDSRLYFLRKFQNKHLTNYLNFT